ncbi:MAG: hypothetical protein HY722_07845 [Planctomycetes bacterium]|nr:hypothetical protein [Planctomycetota bacterium]
MRKRWIVALAAGLVGCASIPLFNMYYLGDAPGALAPGAPAPTFELAVAHGGPPLRLEALLAKGRAVLVFYRGHW